MPTNSKPPAKRAAHDPREEARLRQARERAQAYRNEEPEPRLPLSPDEEHPTTLDEWMDLVGRQVDDAMRRGLFDNLPGHGKPQMLQKDPFVPEDQQMAFSIMKRNQLSPGWIGDRKMILQAKEQLRLEISEAATAFLAKAEQLSPGPYRIRLEEEWADWIAHWDATVVNLNKQILEQNLKQPFAHLEIYQLRLDEELKKAGAARTLPAG